MQIGPFGSARYVNEVLKAYQRAEHGDANAASYLSGLLAGASHLLDDDQDFEILADRALDALDPDEESAVEFLAA